MRERIKITKNPIQSMNYINTQKTIPNFVFLIMLFFSPLSAMESEKLECVYTNTAEDFNSRVLQKAALNLRNALLEENSCEKWPHKTKQELEEYPQEYHQKILDRALYFVATSHYWDEHMNIATFLKGYGANPNSYIHDDDPRIKGLPFIMEAITYQYDHSVEDMIALGADPNFLTSEGRSPLDLVTGERYAYRPSTAELLIKHGAKFSKPDEQLDPRIKSGFKSSDEDGIHIRRRFAKICAPVMEEYVQLQSQYDDMINRSTGGQLPRPLISLIKEYSNIQNAQDAQDDEGNNLVEHGQLQAEADASPVQAASVSAECECRCVIQ